jgi:hypothetical protein
LREIERAGRRGRRRKEEIDAKLFQKLCFEKEISACSVYFMLIIQFEPPVH